MSSPEARLKGARALVTRPKQRAAELCFLLEEEGAEVLALPFLEIQPPLDERALESAAEGIHRYAWVAFTSPAAVGAFFDAIRRAGTVEHLSRVRIATVGEGTSRAVREHGSSVDCESPGGGGEALSRALHPRLAPEDEVLLPAAQEGREELLEALLAEGVRVSRVCAYRAVKATVDPSAIDRIVQFGPQLIFFASPRTVEAFVEALGPRAKAVMNGAKVIAIGKTTAEALAGLGRGADQVAQRPTSEELIHAAVRAFGDPSAFGGRLGT